MRKQIQSSAIQASSPHTILPNKNFVFVLCSSFNFCAILCATKKWQFPDGEFEFFLWSWPLNLHDDKVRKEKKRKSHLHRKYTHSCGKAWEHLASNLEQKFSDLVAFYTITWLEKDEVDKSEEKNSNNIRKVIMSCVVLWWCIMNMKERKGVMGHLVEWYSTQNSAKSEFSPLSTVLYVLFSLWTNQQ